MKLLLLVLAVAVGFVLCSGPETDRARAELNLMIDDARKRGIPTRKSVYKKGDTIYGKIEPRGVVILIYGDFDHSEMNEIREAFADVKRDRYKWVKIRFYEEELQNKNLKGEFEIKD